MTKKGSPNGLYRDHSLWLFCWLREDALGQELGGGLLLHETFARVVTASSSMRNTGQIWFLIKRFYLLHLLWALLSLILP